MEQRARLAVAFERAAGRRQRDRISRVGVDDAIDVGSRFKNFRMDEDLAVPARGAGDDLAVEIHGEDVLRRDLVEAEAVRLHEEQVRIVGQAKRNMAAGEIVLALRHQNPAGDDQLPLDGFMRRIFPGRFGSLRPCSGHIPHPRFSQPLAPPERVAMNEIMDRAHLLDDRRRQDEGIGVEKAHRPVEAVERIAQRNPGLDQRRGVAHAVRIEVDLGVEFARPRQPRPHIDAEGAGHFQRIDDVQVMRPGLGKVLPGMRRRIGADEILPPVRNGAVGVIGLQRRPVIHRFVAENLAPAFDEAAVAHQQVPEIMADLVAKVAEQRAIWLVHDGAPPLALGVVGLFDRERDQAVVVARHHSRPGEMGRACQKIERQALAAVGVALVERQIELHQRVEQAMLGDLDLLPSANVACDTRVGDRPVVPAGGAVEAGRVGLDHPIADAEPRIGAEAKKLVARGKRAPARRRPAPAPTSSWLRGESRGGTNTSRKRCFQNRAVARNADI